jgi:hypothetical protein
VSNRWTRVPASPPPVDGAQLRLLPLADLFMALMLSRPAGLSLRTTWVTPASIWLCLAVAIGLVALGLLALAMALLGYQLLLLLAALPALALAAGAGSVALYGLRQRYLSRR